MNLTPKVWKAIPHQKIPGFGFFGPIGKHTRYDFCRLDGKIYANGGDYMGPLWLQSGRNEMFTFDVAKALADQMPWELIQPYCRSDLGLQPGNPDECGWSWDNNRKVFWHTPGFMWGKEERCPNQMASVVDGKFILTFDPVTKTWTNRSTKVPLNPQLNNTVFDSVTDRLYDITNGTWVIVRYYSPDADLWTTKTLTGKAANVWDEKTTIDEVGRLIWKCGKLGNTEDYHLFSWHIDNEIWTDHGPVPEKPVGVLNETSMVWDSVSKVLYFIKHGTPHMAIYHPDIGTWELDQMVTDPPGLNVGGRQECFDPVNNALLFGGTDFYMFLYRYGDGSITPTTKIKILSSIETEVI